MSTLEQRSTSTFGPYTAEDVVQAVFANYWTGYTETPAIVFGSNPEYTRSAILSAVQNRIRTRRRRSKTRERTSRHVRAEIVAARRDAAAPERRLAEHWSYELHDEQVQGRTRLPQE